MLQPKTRTQIAAELGVCRKTLRKWLEDHKILLPRGAVSPVNQKIIYETFGYPSQEVYEAMKWIAVPQA